MILSSCILKKKEEGWECNEIANLPLLEESWLGTEFSN